MSGTRIIRNSCDYPLLGVLALGPAHGYEICKHIRTHLGEVWRLGRSQVYALLTRMEKDGLVVHERVGQEMRPAKNIFGLTPVGAAVFDEWMREPVRNFRDLRLDFLTKIYFIRLLEPKAERVLMRAQAQVLQVAMERLRNRRNGTLEEMATLALDFRIAMVEAAISWLEAVNLHRSLNCVGSHHLARSGLLD